VLLGLKEFEMEGLMDVMMIIGDLLHILDMVLQPLRIQVLRLLLVQDSGLEQVLGEH
jgi:hypothetical protein